MKKVFITLLFLSVTVAAAGYYLWLDIHKIMAQENQAQLSQQNFIIKRGTGFNRLTAQLKEQGLIDNAQYFKLYAKYYQYG